MNTVDAIKKIKQIDSIKKILRSGNKRDYLLFVMGINIGLRISDLLRLRLGDVLNEKNRPKELFWIKEQKTSKVRKFMINDSVKKALQEVFGGRAVVKPQDFIFVSRKGENKPISRVHAWYVLNQAARSIGITSSIGTHTLRKTFGYHAYKQGIDITLLQSLFNHSTPSITLAYIGITQDDINQVYIRMNL